MPKVTARAAVSTPMTTPISIGLLHISPNTIVNCNSDSKPLQEHGLKANDAVDLKLAFPSSTKRLTARGCSFR